MQEPNEAAKRLLSDIQHLTSFLKSEVSINNPGDKDSVVRIRVFNDAPKSHAGGFVVFLGVGLRIIDGKGTTRGSNHWPSRLTKSRASDQDSIRKQYNDGIWAGGGEAFPAITSDEQKHGEVLFPGETVEYEIKVEKEAIPYLDVAVEGSVSRRHLFHSSTSLYVFKELRLPLITQTFRDIAKIDLYSPILSLRDSMPVIDANTRLADLDAYKIRLLAAIEHSKKIAPELNKVYHSAPNQELRDFMRQQIGNYITTSEKLCSKVLQTISGSDTLLMKDVTEELKAHLYTLDNVNKAKNSIMSKYGINT